MARNLNQFLGTHYTPDDVAGMDEIEVAQLEKMIEIVNDKIAFENESAASRVALNRTK